MILEFLKTYIKGIYKSPKVTTLCAMQGHESLSTCLHFPQYICYETKIQQYLEMSIT